MADEDDDFDPVDDEDVDASIDPETVAPKHRPGRLRRSWRDVERLREERALRRLMTDEDWFEELERY